MQMENHDMNGNGCCRTNIVLELFCILLFDDGIHTYIVLKVCVLLLSTSTSRPFGRPCDICTLEILYTSSSIIFKNTNS